MPARPYQKIKDPQLNAAESCSVCQEQFSLKSSVRKSICGHIFHEWCLNDWLSKKWVCPFCRKGLGKVELVEWIASYK